MIRKFTAADMDRVMEIWLSSNLQAHSFVSAAYWNENYAAVRQEVMNAEVYVYTNDRSNTVDGFIGMVDHYIAGLFVAEQARGKGIGRALLDAAKARNTVLTLDVYQKNGRAVRFYEQAHFAIQSQGVDIDTNEAEYQMVWRRPEV